MEEETVQAIRETNRNKLFLYRRKQKDEDTDVRRSLAKLRETPCDVAAIANKLKTKSLISASDLTLLQNALADHPGNIEVVLSTNGALRGLVRELSGRDVSKQCAACSCLCNLALADVKTCCTVAKAAGVYLVAALDTLTTQLAVGCAWTLGNLFGSGAHTCKLLIAQGAITKLCDVMKGSGDVQDAAIYALVHAAYVLMDDLRTEHLYKIIESFSKMDVNIEDSQLLFLLSCHKDFTPEILPETYLHKMVEKLTQNMENHISMCKEQNDISDNDGLRHSDTKCCELVYLFRVLANMQYEKVYHELDNYFVSNNVIGIIRKLLEVDRDRSLLWLLGNMYNCGSVKFLSVL